MVRQSCATIRKEPFSNKTIIEYRRNHGDAPVPFSPSRGLVVAQETQDEISFRRLVQPPLRLLVIGDSLAAGVGTSQSSTPILPTSIAKILSQATGRPVEWLCKGVPGQSSERIVSDITNLETPPFSEIFVHKLHEFQQEQRARFELAKVKTKEWLDARQLDDDLIVETNDQQNRIVKWWNNTKTKVQRDYQKVRSILHEARNAKPVMDDTTEPKRRNLVRRRTVVLDPNSISRYDVAVVFTGANDLKEAYLPFMMPKDESSDETTNGGGGLMDQFVRILHALESKMRSVSLPIGQPTTATAMAQCGGPLVVFPALPYEPTILNRLAPLSWFLIPLLQTVDRNKERLAQLYPDRVLFVEPPDLHDVGIPMGEPAFISLQDIQHDVKRNLEQLMQEHYYYVDEPNQEYYLYELDEDQVRLAPVVPKLPDVVSADGIHPSDSGYNAWGDHIGEAIVKEFRRRGLSTSAG